MTFLGHRFFFSLWTPVGLSLTQTQPWLRAKTCSWFTVHGRGVLSSRLEWSCVQRIQSSRPTDSMCWSNNVIRSILTRIPFKTIYPVSALSCDKLQGTARIVRYLVFSLIPWICELQRHRLTIALQQAPFLWRTKLQQPVVAAASH